MKEKGDIIIISGPSGCGKGTIVNAFFESKPKNAMLSVSATTRAPREGEKEGVHYFFKTKEEFKELIENGKMLEFTEYCGNFYGTPLEPVLKATENGIDVILEIEVQGAQKVKKLCPQAYLIFIMPPSARELKRRLSGRGSETPESLKKRLTRAAEEMDFSKNYDYVLINDDLQDAVRELTSVIGDPVRNIDDKIEFVKGVRKNVKAISKRISKER